MRTLSQASSLRELREVSEGTSSFLVRSLNLGLPLALFLVALAVYVCAIGWGLPNGNTTWAADAIKPAAPLSIAKRILSGPPWNTGWFWFKYPLGHVFLLCAVYAPYMFLLWISGQISDPSNVYPYGLAHPEEALAMLAFLGRSVSALMGAGCVVLVFLVSRELFGRRAALLAAIITTFTYPVIYYSHTTNVEIPYLFWLLLALYCTIRLVAGSAPGWYLALGGAAAMAVSTKEIAAGFLVALPITILVAHWRRTPREGILPRGVLAGVVAAVAVLVVVNNVLLNPSGFLNRIRFLTHTLDGATLEKYAGYYFPIALNSARGWEAELSQLWHAGRQVVASLGWPASLAALLGVAVSFSRHRVRALLLLLPALFFYLLGPRAMLSLSLRYVMPLAVIGGIFGGAGIGWLWECGRWRVVWRGIGTFIICYTIVYGLDVNHMLNNDGRYGAERWLRARVGKEDRVEVYQLPTYLPRFPKGLQVERISFDQTRIGAFRARQPDYLVLSSAGLPRITIQYSKDWRTAKMVNSELVPAQRSVTGEVMNYEHRGNRAFLDSLRDGSLGYVPVARFRATPWIERPLIQGLNPEIVIYGQPGQVGVNSSHEGGEHAQ